MKRRYIIPSPGRAAWVLALPALLCSLTGSIDVAAQGFSPVFAAPLVLDPGDRLGSAVGAAGDLDRDGVADLVVGIPGDDIDGPDRGAVWIYYLNADGSVRSRGRLRRTDGPLDFLHDRDFFGQHVAAVGDVDGNGFTELAVGTGEALWLVRLLGNGSIRSAATLVEGRAVHAATGTGDLDADGIPDLAVAVDDGIELVFLQDDGTVKGRHALATDAAWPEAPGLGTSLVGVGDLDADGTPDLLAASEDAVWRLALRPDGSLISATRQEWPDGVRPQEGTRTVLSALGDLDGDGVPDAGVGKPDAEEGRGAAWIVRLGADGSAQGVSSVATSGMGLLAGDAFGWSLVPLGDVDGDGRVDVALGVPGRDDAVEESGEVVVTSVRPDLGTDLRQVIGNAGGGLPGLHERRVIEFDVLGDVDGNGYPDLMVNRGNDQLVLFLQDGFRVESMRWVDAVEGSFAALGDFFGTGLAAFATLDGNTLTVAELDRSGALTRFVQSFVQAGVLSNFRAVGDVDGDGVTDLAAGYPYISEAGPNWGGVYLYFLNADGRVQKTSRLLPTEGGPTGNGPDRWRFGQDLAAVGDVDGDGVPDLAVGSPGDGECGPTVGALWILFLNRNGEAARRQKINCRHGTLPPRVKLDQWFTVLGSLGDLDRDGIPDLASSHGILFLNRDGTVRTARPFTPALIHPFDLSITWHAAQGVGRIQPFTDLDGDGIPEIAALASSIDDNRWGVLAFSLKGLLDMDATLMDPMPAVPDAESSVRVRVQVHDLSSAGIAEAWVHFRRAGDPVVFSSPMEPESDNTYAFTIPGFALGDRGLEYYVTAANTYGLEVRVPEQGTVALPVYLPDGLATPLVSGTAAGAYRLVSVPLDLEEKDWRTLLERNLGAYDPTRWRAYWLQPGGNLVEFGVAAQELNPGHAFWLLTTATNPFLETGPGRTISTGEPFGIRLGAGWTLVGQPFNFAVDASALYTSSGQPVDLRSYEGAWTIHDAPLRPFWGYAVFNNTAEVDTLWIDPNAGSAGKTSASRSAAFTPDWSLRVSARQGAARDVDNVLAVHARAADGWDVLDRPEPPPIGDYVSLAFPHPGWSAAATRYNVDVRPPPADGASWPLDLIARRPGPVTLRVEGLDTVPEAFDVWLIDEAAGIVKDLRADPHYDVVSGTASVPRALTVAVGRPGYLERAGDGSPDLPTTYALHPVFPNPFSAATTLRYALPEASTVRLELFDALGRRVATLVDAEQPAGTHVLVWDGRTEAGGPAASGLYVARLRAGRFTATRRLVLVR